MVLRGRHTPTWFLTYISYSPESSTHLHLYQVNDDRSSTLGDAILLIYINCNNISALHIFQFFTILTYLQICRKTPRYFANNCALLNLPRNDNRKF